MVYNNKYLSFSKSSIYFNLATKYFKYDINPATKILEGDYGKKSKGSITEAESTITEENGFKNITTLKAGENPEDYINKLLNGNAHTSNRHV